MTESWVVSKESMKVFDLLEACAGILFALDQSSKTDRDRTLSQREIKQKIQSGRKLLDKLILALESKRKHHIESDPFILRLISEIRRDSSLTYAKLLERTLKTRSELRRHEISPETIETLENIYKNLMSLSTKRTESLSPSLT